MSSKEIIFYLNGKEFKQSSDGFGIGVNEWVSLANAKEKISKTQPVLILEPPRGVEPRTFTLRKCCSTN